MKPEEWRRLEALFEEAEAVSPEERTAFLDRACPDDPALRSRVMSLLGVSGDASDFLAGVVSRSAEAMTSEPDAGQRIGAYRVVRPVGQGGMGMVYLAERADDEFAQEVALKFIRMSLATPELLERFRGERQMLANLNHPHIARLLDGGTTDAGVPYVALEYVDGRPLDSYCDAERLSLRDRLEIFLAVCDAVSHAHRNLIVHRDLKPGNILVTEDGIPKLLDFGIAKLLDPGDEAMETRTGMRLMTPSYASPEQVRGEPVTTASDVYSLGVVLFELLTGQRPYDVSTSDPVEVVRVVCDTAPNRPSTVVTHPRQNSEPNTAPVSPEELSLLRRTVPHRLRRQLSGDLDNIVLMTLRKESERRYGSVDELASDIRRYLDGRPVRACPDTWSYRTGKFVRRNRVAVAASIAVIMLIASVIGFYTARLASERDRAMLEAAKADQVATFLQELFEVADPNRTQGEDISARELLDRGAERIGVELLGQPEVQGTMLGVIGGVYLSLGHYDRALVMRDSALSVTLTRYGDGSLETGRALAGLATAHYFAGRYNVADTLYRLSLGLTRSHLGDDDPEVATRLMGLAENLDEIRELDTADSLYAEALRIRELHFEPQSMAIAEVLDAIGALRKSQGDYAGAEPLFRRSLAIVEINDPDSTVAMGVVANNLADALQRQGKSTEAEPLYRTAMAIFERVLGQEHPFTATGYRNLGIVVRDLGRLEEAEELFRHALSLNRLRLGDTHPTVATSLGLLASLLADTGQFDEAEPLLQEALTIRSEALGADHPYVAISQNELAGMYRQKGDFVKAEPLYRQALALRRRVHPPGHPYLAYSLVGLGSLLLETGRADEAEEMLREALDIRRQVLPPGHWRTAEVESALGACLLAQGNVAEADQLIRGSYASLVNTLGERDSYAVVARERLDRLNEGRRE